MNSDDKIIVPRETQKLNISVLGLFTVADGVTQVTSAEDYTLISVDENGRTIRQFTISTVQEDAHNNFIRYILI